MHGFSDTWILTVSKDHWILCLDKATNQQGLGFMGSLDLATLHNSITRNVVLRFPKRKKF